MTSAPRESILVVLPGSVISEASVRVFAKAVSLDNYQARTKLTAQFPLPVARLSADAVEGELGTALEKAGIKFFAIDEESFDAPFEGFLVHRCEFHGGQIRFLSQSGTSCSVALEEKVFLVELRYREEVRSKRIETKRIPLSTKSSSLQATTDLHKHVATRQVLHLYIQGRQHPLLLIDDEIDYSSLGMGVEQNATWNFLRLKGTIEQVFEVAADRTLIDYSFVAQSVFTGENVDGALSGRRENTASSNVEAANKLSRVLYAAWLYQLGN